MENPYQPSSYQLPNQGPSNRGYGQGGKPFNSTKVVAPGIALIVVGVLGLLLSIFSVGIAVLGTPPAPDPTKTPFENSFQRGRYGPTAAVIQSGFIILNSVIIAGGIAMVRVKTWGLALTSTIIAMVNFGNCCCIIGLPVGIWSIVILFQEDVKRAFNR